MTENLLAAVNILQRARPKIEVGSKSMEKII
jgi:hypothetical protein